MKIVVDCMPEHPWECRNCHVEGDAEYHYWVCQVGEEKHICKNTKDCPYFVGLFPKQPVYEVVDGQICVKKIN